MRRQIILASASPRRIRLLEQIGIPAVARPSGIAEEHRTGIPFEDLVIDLARRKAAAVAPAVSDGYVIGADTIVVVDGKILGKPSSRAEASSMLRALSGRTHQVYTGFVVIEKPGNRTIADFEMTAVTFRALGDREIDEYVGSGSPMDKAGGYGIQDDRGALFVERIDGCFYNVVGFPLSKFYIRFVEMAPDFLKST